VEAAPLRLWWVAVAAAAGCGEGVTSSETGAPPETRASEPRAEAPAGDPSPPALPSCARILTTDDIRSACGVDTEHEVTRSEGQSPLARCSRKLRGADGRSISFKLAEHPSLEKVSSIPWYESAQPLADLGDAAAAYVEPKGGQFDWHTVEVRFGRRILYLRSINATGGAPLCTTEQLTTVARVAMERIAAG
jgi:hypothetical protein